MHTYPKIVMSLIPPNWYRQNPLAHELRPELSLSHPSLTKHLGLPLACFWKVCNNYEVITWSSQLKIKMFWQNWVNKLAVAWEWWTSYVMLTLKLNKKVSTFTCDWWIIEESALIFSGIQFNWSIYMQWISIFNFDGSVIGRKHIIIVSVVYNPLGSIRGSIVNAVNDCNFHFHDSCILRLNKKMDDIYNTYKSKLLAIQVSYFLPWSKI